MTECPTCWGTGFVKGWGGPCSKGCPIPTQKQGLSSVTNSDDLDTDTFYGVGTSAPEEVFKRAKAALDLEDQFIAPKVFPKMVQGRYVPNPAGNPFSPPPQQSIRSIGAWSMGYLRIDWKGEEITFRHKLHAEVETFTLSRLQGAVPGVTYTPSSNHLAAQFLINSDPKALAETVMFRAILPHFPDSIRNHCSLYETSVIKALTEIFDTYFNQGTKP